MSTTAVISTLVLVLQVWTSPSNPSQNRSAVGQQEEYDVLLTDGTASLGLVRLRRLGGDLCIVVDDVKKNLGFQADATETGCMSSDEIMKQFKIPLKFNAADVHLILGDRFAYPAKDYQSAMDRIESITEDPFGTVQSIPYAHPSFLPELRSYSLSLRSLNQRSVSTQLHTELAGDLFGGALATSTTISNDPQGGAYGVRHLQYRWFMKQPSDHQLVPHIEIGNQLSDRDGRYHIHGVRLSNRSAISTSLYVDEYIRLRAPAGSIIEWAHQSGTKGFTLVEDGHQAGVVARLGLGLNQLRYRVTAPGMTTRELVQWIRVPNQSLPKGTLVYDGLIGQSGASSEVFQSVTTVDYGLGNRIRVGVLHASRLSRSNSDHRLNVNAVWRPSFTSEIGGSFGTDAAYAMNALAMYPTIGTIEVSDMSEKPSWNGSDGFKRRQSRVSASIERLFGLHHQLSFSRIETNRSTISSVDSYSSKAINRWVITASAGYEWWRHQSMMTAGQANTNGYIGYRWGRAMMVEMMAQARHLQKVHLESLKLSAHFQASKVQMGSNISVSSPWNTVGVGFYARFASDFFQASTVNEHYKSYRAYSQTLSTSWTKSDARQWHPSSNTGTRSSGFILVSFHDANGDGVRNKDEPELRGLTGNIKEGRMLEEQKHPSRLRIDGLQPYRTYRINLDPDLVHEPDFIVQVPSIRAEAPSSGYQTIHVPAVRSIELSGTWTLGDASSIQPGRSRLVFSTADGSRRVHGTLFPDGSWIVDKIGPGEYHITVQHNQRDELVAVPGFIKIGQRVDIHVPEIVIRAKTATSSPNDAQG